MEYELKELLTHGSVNILESELPKFKKILESKDIKFCTWLDDCGGCEVDFIEE